MRIALRSTRNLVVFFVLICSAAGVFFEPGVGRLFYVGAVG
jgi:hypothetical protein